MNGEGRSMSGYRRVGIGNSCHPSAIYGVAARPRAQLRGGEVTDKMSYIKCGSSQPVPKAFGKARNCKIASVAVPHDLRFINNADYVTPLPFMGRGRG